MATNKESEKSYESSGPPRFDSNDFLTWKSFFVAYLRGNGSAHKCLNLERPDINKSPYIDEFEQLCVVDENGILLPDDAAKAFIKKISAAARKWDKRNDKAVALIFQAINRSSNAIAKQVILEASNEISATELLKLLEERFNLKDIRVIQMTKRTVDLESYYNFVICTDQGI